MVGAGVCMVGQHAHTKKSANADKERHEMPACMGPPRECMSIVQRPINFRGTR